MLFVKTLSDAEIISRQWITREHLLSWTRIRANSVLLRATNLRRDNQKNQRLL